MHTDQGYRPASSGRPGVRVRLYEYQKNGGYFAQVAAEMVSQAEDELASLGAASIRPVHRGIHFETDLMGLLRITYHTRLATTILAPLSRFRCHAPKYLYKKARLLAWQDLISGDFLKQRCRGSSAYVYFGDPGLIPAIGLRPAWKRPLKNGALDGRLARFDIY